jgi:hypothetical protein
MLISSLLSYENLRREKLSSSPGQSPVGAQVLGLVGVPQIMRAAAENDLA